MSGLWRGEAQQVETNVSGSGQNVEEIFSHYFVHVQGLPKALRAFIRLFVVEK
tara:strand:- start:998 stop:1156 length:159 start_codon:yes stop_codon:yes gene_type:complete